MNGQQSVIDVEADVGVGIDISWNYYSSIKWTEILTPATVWMNPDNVMLGETSQTHAIRFPFPEAPRAVRVR